jgi:hypothetical protein
MFNKYFNLKFILPVFALLFLVSCNLDELREEDPILQGLLIDVESLSAEEYTADLAEVDMNEEWGPEMQRFKGKRPCFKFIFPLTVIFSDTENREFNSPEEFREAMEAWKIENPGAEHPIFDFPIEVELKGGDIRTIGGQEDFEALKQECFDNRPDFPRWQLCFKPLFPLDILFPGETDPETMETPMDLKEAMREWKLNNPGAEDHPVIVFPILIEMEGDGADVEIKDMKDLKEYLKDCIIEMMKGKKGKKGKGMWGNKGGK